MNMTHTATDLKTQWDSFVANASSWTTIADVDTAFNQAITWLGPDIEMI